MAKLYKFPSKDKKYSKDFMDKINPNAIGDFIKEHNPHLTLKAADALALTYN